jgi:hypothetical protein
MAQAVFRRSMVLDYGLPRYDREQAMARNVFDRVF